MHLQKKQLKRNTQPFIIAPKQIFSLYMFVIFKTAIHQLDVKYTKIKQLNNGKRNFLHVNKRFIHQSDQRQFFHWISLWKDYFPQLKDIEYIGAILFDEKFCLEIQENNLFRLSYANETTLLCSTKYRIITCAYYINDEKNTSEIHILQENHKIHAYYKKDGQVIELDRNQYDITSVSCFLDMRQPKVFYGKREGGIVCYFL